MITEKAKQKKELLRRLDVAKRTIRNVECLYEEAYDATYDYMQETGDWELESLFDEYVDTDWVEHAIRDQLESGGFERVWCLLSGIKEFREYYRVDNYGNLENLDKNDIDLLIEAIEDEVKN